MLPCNIVIVSKQIVVLITFFYRIHSLKHFVWCIGRYFKKDSDREMKKILLGLFIFTLFFSPCEVGAQTQQQKREVKVYFNNDTSSLDVEYRDNRKALNLFREDVRSLLADKSVKLSQINIESSTSPEGMEAYNKQLAAGRAASLVKWIRREMGIETDNINITSKVDWETLREMVYYYDNVPFRDDIIAVLEAEYSDQKRLEALMELHDSIPYNWLYVTLFPYMRYAAAELTFYFETVAEAAAAKQAQERAQQNAAQERAQQNVPAPTEQVAAPAPTSQRKNFYIAVKNNMLYDLITIPNIGMEFYLGGNVSLVANSHLSWWSKSSKDWYLRTIGGDVALRYWLGKASRNKPLTGHHLGIYGQTITYDFEFGNKGIIADKLNWSAGLEYGYSLPVARRLNIDFTAGVGYHWGEYEEYIPEDGHYSWLSTNRRRYIGPTKLEISLVWLIGRGNYNKSKGGQR